MNDNQRTRFIFDGMPIRGVHVHLNEVWQHILERKHYPVPIRRALGELLVAGALLSSNLKLEGTLILQIQGQGILKMLVVEATSENTVRATTRWDETAYISDDADLGNLLGESAIFAITLQPKDGEQWQGVVPLEGNSIAQMLMNYMLRSEQLETYIVLAADDEHAAGLLLQRLPEQQLNDEQWQYMLALAQTLAHHELLHLDAQNILYRLFHETPPRVFPNENLEFACTCSREKVGNMLLMLGAKEVVPIVVDEGSITVDCDFCHENYTFEENDMTALFGQEVVHAISQNKIN